MKESVSTVIHPQPSSLDPGRPGKVDDLGGLTRLVQINPKKLFWDSGGGRVEKRADEAPAATLNGPATKAPLTKPEMLEDLISSHSLLSHCLVAVSTGYFIHDFLDVSLNQSLKQSWELLLHHSTVISCFTLAVTSRLYLGFAVVSLLIEINSVFLHIRQLLLLLGQGNRTGTAASHTSVTYSLTSWLNLGTLLVFRICTMGWMTRWLASHREHMPRFVFMTGTTGLSLISTMNMVLLYRLLRADFLTNLRNTSKNH